MYTEPSLKRKSCHLEVRNKIHHNLRLGYGTNVEVKITDNGLLNLGRLSLRKVRLYQ